MSLTKKQRKEGWIEPTKEQCGNCYADLDKGDKFCKVCGTKVGEGAYKPYKDKRGMLYGPPPVYRTHICEVCGYSWKTCFMIDEQKYCPKCGGNAPYDESLNEKFL